MRAPSLALAVLCAALSTPVTARALFDGREALAISYRPAAAELADLDGDQDLDLVVASMGEFSSNQWNGCLVHVFRNPGQGAFSSAAPDVYVVPDAPEGLALGDFNEDGWLDLVTPNAAPDNLQVLLNTGTGTFTPGATIPVQADPVDVVAFDLNGDELADLASADQFGFGVSVVFNLGGGLFGTPQFYPLGNLVNGIDGGDVDGDEDVDLVAFTNDDAILLRNTGGGMGAPQALGIGPVHGDARLAFLDADTAVDLVAGDCVWLGHGNGTFGPLPVATGLPAGAVRCVDFDGDGRADVVTAAGVALGDGQGGFTGTIDFDAPPDPGPIACGDFTDDAVLDLVRCQGGIAGPLGFATLLPGMGGGSVPVFARQPGGDSVWGAAAADVDGDDNLDLLVANIGTPWGQFLNGSVAVLTGDGAGGLAPFVAYPAGNYVRGVFPGDFNGDEAPDAVAPNFNAGAVSLLTNNGAGGFLSPVPLPAGAHPEAAAFADFNGDQHLDLAVTDYGLGASPAQVVVLLGDGAGGVLATSTMTLTGRSAADIAAVDLTGDGAPDLAVACTGRYYGGSWSDYGLYVLLNNGTGTFGAEQRYQTTYTARTVNPLFPGRPGTPDLVVTTHGPAPSVLYCGEVVTFFNDGTGHFHDPVATSLTHDHFTSICDDFDGDGHGDLVVPCLSAAVVTILWGDGSGRFPRQTHYATAAEPRALAAGDFNTDGLLDLAVGHSEANDVGLLLSLPPAAGVPENEPDRQPVASAAVTIAPNPASGEVGIRCRWLAPPGRGQLELAVYDAAGRRMVTAYRGVAPWSGFLEARWDGRDMRGRVLPGGLYCVRVAGPGISAAGHFLRVQ